MNVQQMCNSATIMMVKQATKNMSSHGINKMFTKDPAIEKREHLRHRINTKSTMKRKGVNFLDTARTQFNNLPLTLRNDSLSKYGFKKELKVHMTAHYLLPRH